jgi:hypothetical protein
MPFTGEQVEWADVVINRNSGRVVKNRFGRQLDIVFLGDEVAIRFTPDEETNEIPPIPDYTK